MKDIKLIFGDGIFGNKLEDNNFITVDYITSMVMLQME